MILYIGNNIKSSFNNVTTLSLLSSLLKKEGYSLEIASSKKNQLLRVLDMLWNVIKYKKNIDYILIDTYSTRNFYYTFATSQLARLLKLKYIPILHGGNLPNRLERSPKLSNLIFKNSYKNIAPSNYLKIAFEKKGYNVLFVPNVLEIQKYQFKKRTTFKPYLLYVRAFKELYNPKLAVYVLAKLKETFPNARLCMVGPDKDGALQECKDLALSLKVDSAIAFKGILSKKKWHKLSEEYDVFINTTNFDNTPVSVMEAMALGLPVVSTNVGGLPYLIDDNKSGILVPPNDIDSMTNVIKMLLNDIDRLKELSSNARNKVEQFDWEFVKHQWKAILK